MDSSLSVWVDQYLHFVAVIFFTLSFLAIFLVFLNYRKNHKLVLARCGHFTKMKGVIFVGNIKIPVDLSHRRYIPDKCIECLRRETLGDI